MFPCSLFPNTFLRQKLCRLVSKSLACLVKVLLLVRTTAAIRLARTLSLAWI